MRRSGDWCVRSWLLLPEMHRLLNILQGMKDQYLFPVGQPSDCCVQMIAPSRRLFCLAPARCGQRQVDHTGIVSGAGFPDKPSRLQRPHGLADREGAGGERACQESPLQRRCPCGLPVAVRSGPAQGRTGGDWEQSSERSNQKADPQGTSTGPSCPEVYSTGGASPGEEAMTGRTNPHSAASLMAFSRGASAGVVLVGCLVRVVSVWLLTLATTIVCTSGFSHAAAATSELTELSLEELMNV